MKGLVSVIIPVYNVVLELEKCVKSIVYQSYKNLEIILVDDGSLDGSSQLCDSLQEKYSRIKVIHQKNGGLSAARNTGLKNARGEYVLFVDSDDYIHTSTVEVAVRTSEILNVDVVEFGYKNVKTSYATDIIKRYTIEKHTKEETIQGVIDWKKHYPMACSKLYKKKVIDGISFKVGYVHEDEFFFNEWIKKVDFIGCILEPLYYYRVREGSIMGQKFTMKRVVCFDAYIARYYYLKTLSKDLGREMLKALMYQFNKKIDLINNQNSDDKDELIKAIVKKYSVISRELLDCPAIWEPYKERFKEVCAQYSK